MRVEHEVFEDPRALQQLFGPHSGALQRNERLATRRRAELKVAARRLHDGASLVKEIAGEGGGAAKIPVRIGGFFVERIDLANVLIDQKRGKEETLRRWALDWMREMLKRWPSVVKSQSRPRYCESCMETEAKKNVGVQQIEVFERFGEHEGGHFPDHFAGQNVLNRRPAALRVTSHQKKTLTLVRVLFS